MTHLLRPAAFAALILLAMSQTHGFAGQTPATGADSAAITRTTPTASPQQKFDLLYEQLQAVHADYTHIVWTTLSLIIVALGWVLTGKSAQDALRRRPTALRVAAIAIVLAGVVHTLGVAAVCRESRRIDGLLAAIDIAPKSLYVHFRVTPRMASLNLGVNLLLLFLLYHIVRFIAARPPQPEEPLDEAAEAGQGESA